MNYYHVDVFSKGPFTGNGLSVMLGHEFPPIERMQLIAQEMKQFETIFLKQEGADVVAARIFTVEEELPFAGHPVLGAAAVLHREYFCEQKQTMIHLQLKDKAVAVTSQALAGGMDYLCTMNQGKMSLLGEIPQMDYPYLLEPLKLTRENLADGLPLEVVSAGLPYLLVPVKSGLETTGIFVQDYENRLLPYQAKFAYIFDVNCLEGRTWDNLGAVEDVATGSAAGPVGDYLIRHGLCSADETIVLHQGRFLNRPSEITVQRKEGDILVSGRVTVVANGHLTVA